MADPIQLTVGMKYPVLIDGAPAPDLAWNSDAPAGSFDIRGDAATGVFAFPLAAAPAFTLTATGEGRTGSVAVELEAAPFVISFGPGEPA